jgi:hypothetical protein
VVGTRDGFRHGGALIASGLAASSSRSVSKFVDGVGGHTLTSRREEGEAVTQKDTIARSLHDLGLASWFGGSLMGAVGLNAAAGEVAESRQRSRVANEGWARWTPVNAAAIGAHVLGASQLTWTNKGRIVAQRGVKTATYAKSAMTLAALAATAYSRILGKRM